MTPADMFNGMNILFLLVLYFITKTVILAKNNNKKYPRLLRILD